MAAHNGQLTIRAQALRACRRFEAAIARGEDLDESAEAEAGALLEAEAQDNVGLLVKYFKQAWGG